MAEITGSWNEEQNPYPMEYLVSDIYRMEALRYPAITDFYDAFRFLCTNRVFEGAFGECLDVDVVKVDPITRCITGDESKDTHTEVWLEAGPPGCHDFFLDCGGDSYEEAIIKLANLVMCKYGEAETKATIESRILLQ